MCAKRIALHSCFAALVVSHLAWAGEPQAEKSEDIRIDSRPSVVVYQLTDEERQFHMPRALMGDRLSGYCLAMHFSFIDSRHPDARYWITVAAENGDPYAMMMLAIRLNNMGNPRDSSRARFWKDRAAKASIPQPTEAECRRITE